MKISVNIPDAVLSGEIEKTLGKFPGAPILLAEMASLTKLDTRSYKVNNLTGLECATNLETLNLCGTDVLDFTPLANLTNLRRLSLDSTDVSDLSPLANLTNLERLYLSGTDISDITPLENLTKLQIYWK